MRLIGPLSEAAESGVRIGRQRRGVMPAELAPFTHSPRLTASFWRGYKRGRRLQAMLEQQALELTEGNQ